ncbi:T9SS C-terminal target domain-containing protein [Dokdonia sinensis]|uniref:T9SS C-terminal target domain-containing protein n=1 Tax=Dokdonia sinensis TaxID=2479847 RepID=A0A3M0H327_9FLAO|nr:T9SS type A sorting domain-containing protein [Dokdonia sinensis]RMB64066.1 T9SS C-terminal target domain-containing protein [Dokdonia sinensis]
MKQLFTLALFALTGTTVFGQLYVKPTTTSASYVYVEDTFIYVKEGVELETNDIGTITSADERKFPSIALRQGAQLLQGNNALKNTGDGFLSVFQEGTADAYNYNFWASPVGVSTGSDVNNFRVSNTESETVLFNPTTILRSNPPNILAPNGGYNGTNNSGALSVASYWLFKKPHGDDYGSWQIVWDTGSVAPGYGFTMKGIDGTDMTDPGEGSPNNLSNQGQRYDFKGRANNGTIAINVLPDDEILIGNPYPSAFDLSYFLLSNSGTSTFNYTNTSFTTNPQSGIVQQDILSGSAHFWEYDPTVRSHFLTEYQGGYGVFTPVDVDTDGMYMPATFATYNEDGTVNDPGSGDSMLMINRRFSPIGQGFFVYASPRLATATDAIIDNRYRVYRKEGDLSDFKSSDTEETYTIPQVRLNVNINDTYSRQLAMAFWDTATLGAETGMDGKNVSIIDTDAFFVIDGQDNFVLNTHKFDRDNFLPITLKVGAQSEFNIKVASQIDFPGNGVYLYDQERNEFHDILNGEVRYMLDPGIYENRFFVTFKKKGDDEETDENDEDEEDDDTLSLEDSILESFDIFQNNPSGQLEIQNPKNVVLKNVSLYDIAGKQIFNRTDLGADQTYTFPTGNLSDAIYVVRIVTEQGLTKARKISVFNK